jgi:hypothetical protein
MAVSNKVRAARRAFVRRYSKNTAAIVRFTRKGWSAQRIANKLGVSVPSVVTTLGNLTRGFYKSYVDACKY